MRSRRLLGARIFLHFCHITCRIEIIVSNGLAAAAVAGHQSLERCSHSLAHAHRARACPTVQQSQKHRRRKTGGKKEEKKITERRRDGRPKQKQRSCRKNI